VRPVWLDPWAFVGLVVAGILAVVWAVGELAYWQRARLARVRDRVTD
jgi:hypothetical protein